MTKHTPGPWRVRAITPDVVETAHGTRICGCMGDLAALTNNRQAEANARLCAAAPTLLTMLQRLLAEVMQDEQVFSRMASLTLEQAREAVAKAEGVTP